MYLQMGNVFLPDKSAAQRFEKMAGACGIDRPVHAARTGYHTP